MKGKSFYLITALILFITFQNIHPFNQVNETFEVRLTSIRYGNKNVPRSEWEGLKIQHGASITFEFNSTLDESQQVYYRVYLDGNIMETRLTENYYTFKKLDGGVHILRIIPVAFNGEIGRSLVYSFSVTGESISESAKEDESGQGSFLQNPIVIYVLIGIVIVQFILIGLLAAKRKGNKDDNKIKNQALQELSDLRHSHKRIIEEIKNYKEENEYLRTQIKQLDQNISMLEDANVQLIEQKEKLAESKRKLELLQTQKEELFAMAIHDIKNPASAIRSYIQLLNSYDLNASEQQEVMASLVSSSEDIVKLSVNMCDIIAKSMPEPKLAFSSSSLIKIIDNVCNQNISYAKTKKVKLLNKSSRDIPDLNLDPEKIEEALDNLVNNAIKYAPEGTIIEVYSYLKQDDKKTVVVEVQDNGVGLSEADAARCFQKGVILSSVPTGLERSSGLGLWIVKRIIDEHNGKVWVNSKLKAGSTFGFELPTEQSTNT